MSDPVTTTLRFPGWELMPDQRRLLVHGQPAKLGGRAFDLLCLLARHAGRVVDKDEIFRHVWQGLVVEENNLTVQVTTLRKLLGAATIATVAGRGYQLTVQPLAPPAAPVATLVGRQAELDALIGLAGQVPLLTLVGTGGVGKTCLARAVMHHTPLAPRDGLHWVDLAPLQDGARVPAVVAKTLDIALTDAAHADEDLAAALSRLDALVVLDNCEHLADAVAAFLAGALAAAPRVRWLVTSQTLLRLQGETVFRLEPLAVPDEHCKLEDALRHAALALLVERAQAADRRFALTAESLPSAIALCRAVDGLPLALEMSAARVATLGLQGVQRQLDQRLSLLVGPRDAPQRHRTLEQTYDWSYGLLTADEQRLFRRLEPFAGGFDPELADGLADGGERLALAALVDKSLLHRAADGTRLRLLESARDYARLRLADAGETTLARRRHAHAVVRFFAAAGTHLNQWRDADWAARYVAERHNVRTALDFARDEGDATLLARLVAALGQIDTLMQARAEITQVGIDPALLQHAAPHDRARACVELGWAHYLDGSRETGTVLMEQALADFEAVGDTAGAYRALGCLIRLYEARPGRHDAALAGQRRLEALDAAQVPLRVRLTVAVCAGLIESTHGVERVRQLESLSARAGFDALVGVCRTHLTDQLLIERRFEEAVQTARRYLDEGEHRPRARAMICHNLALGLVQLGRSAEAEAPARAALRALPSSSYLVADAFALAAARSGRLADAALLAGHAAEVRRARDLRSDPAEAAAIAETRQRVQDGLGAAQAAELAALGAAMSGAEALAIALPAG